MYGKLKNINNKTDIYAYGATMWEMFAQGTNPIHCPPLNTMNPQEVNKCYFVPVIEKYGCTVMFLLACLLFEYVYILKF